MSAKDLQHWFGGVIAKPLTSEGRIQLTDFEAAQYIAPGHTLSPLQRIEIYNQQYWYRLLNVMQENFPLVVRLFGYSGFNQQIAIPYLAKYPPQSWSLNPIGDHILEWFDKVEHLPIVRLAAEIDLAFHQSFFTPNYPPLQGDPEEIFQKQLTVIPHLIAADRDLLPHRETFLAQDVEYWLSADFPEISHEKAYYAIHRSSWTRLSKGEYTCLKNLTSLQELCDQFEEEDLPLWIQQWTMKNWITESSHSKLS